MGREEQMGRVGEGGMGRRDKDESVAGLREVRQVEASRRKGGRRKDVMREGRRTFKTRCCDKRALSGGGEG